MKIRSSYRAPQQSVSDIGMLHRQRSQADTAQYSALSDIALEALHLNKVREHYKTERETQEFRLQSAVSERSFTEIYGTKSTLTSDEVSKFIGPEEIGKRGIRLTESYTTEDGMVSERPRQDIPAHEVYPVMYKSFMQKNIPVWGAQISDDMARDRSVSTKLAMMQPKFLKASIDAIATQRKLTRNAVGLDVDQLLTKGMYEAARNRILSSAVLSPTERKRQITAVDKRQETDGYANLITQGDVGKLQVALDTLSMDFSSYQDRDGTLSAPERTTHWGALNRRLVGVNREQDVTNRGRLAVARQEVQTEVTNIEQGMFPDTDWLRDRETIIFASGTPQDLQLLQKVANAKYYGTTFLQINTESHLTSQARIDQVLSDNAGVIPNIAALEKRLRRANDNKQQALDHDAVGHGRKFSAIPPFNPATMTDTERPDNTFIAAKRTAVAMKIKFGVNNAFFSRSDWATFSQTFDGADMEGKAAILAAATTVFRGDTERFFESGLSKDAGPMAVAGIIAAENPIGARVVLQGQGMLKSKDFRAPTDFSVAAGEVLKQAFGDPDVSAQRLSAVRAAYVYLAYQEEGLDNATQVTDTKILKAAIAATTKGIIEYNGVAIELPGIKETKRTFENTIEEISSQHWEREGGFIGVTGKQVKEGLDEETMTLRRAGAGKYNIIGPDGRAVFSKATGDVYEFDYNADLFTMSEAAALEKDDKYRAGLVDPGELAKKQQKRIDHFNRGMGFGGL